MRRFHHVRSAQRSGVSVNDKYVSNNGAENPAVATNTPYIELASIYDNIMDHVDYASWAQYIDKLIWQFYSSSADILDVACGTGSLGRELYPLGHRLTGCDISPPMLAVAATKWKSARIPTLLFASNMTALGVQKQFDVVLCLYDSINYCVEAERFHAAVAEAARVTRPGGIYIFDICTVKNSTMYFSQSTMDDRCADMTYRRICRFDPVTRIQENHFYLTRAAKTHIERHYQKIYFIDEIKAMIDDRYWDMCACYDDLSFNEGSEESERVHFVLRRKQN